MLALDGAAVLHRQESGWRIEAASGDRVPESLEASSTTIELDSEHVLALSGAPVRSEDQRVLEAVPRSLQPPFTSASWRPGPRLQAPCPRPTNCGRRSSPPSRTTCARPSPRSRPRSRACLQRDIEWTPEARQEFLETINEETDRLNALVGNLLDMSRLQAGALEIIAVPVGLDEVLPAALNSIGVPDGSIQLDVPETLPRVLADRGLLERALANVISNAIRFSPPASPARVIAGVVDGVVDVRVVDRGTTSPAQNGSDFSSHFNGSGTLVRARASGSASPSQRGFLEAMGGEIEADDTPGGGLTIVARLRAAE